MDNLKRKLEESNSTGRENDVTTKTVSTSSSSAVAPIDWPKRMKNGRSPNCTRLDDDDDDDDSPTTETETDFAESFGFNPASMAGGQWREAKSEPSDSFRRVSSESDNEDDGERREKEKEEEEEMGQLLVNDVGKNLSDNVHDGDVNLVLDLLMRKVCLDSFDV